MKMFTTVHNIHYTANADTENRE